MRHYVVGIALILSNIVMSRQLRPQPSPSVLGARSWEVGEKFVKLSDSFGECAAREGTPWLSDTVVSKIMNPGITMS